MYYLKTVTLTYFEGELLCVSGDLGGAYIGLQLLEREKQIFLENPTIQPDLEGKDYVIERQLKPEDRKDIIKLLKDLDVKPTSMIDISDGLSSEIIHICKQSNVGCDLYEDKIPLDPQVISTCEEFDLNSTTIALSGGEDYELLFTMKQADYDKMTMQEEISVIGYMCDASEGTKLITKGNNLFDITAQGWNAFGKEV